MPDLDPAVLAEMTTEVVAAYVAQNHVPASDMPALISTVHASLAGLGSGSAATTETAPLVPAVPIRKSVTDDYIISLEDGRKFRSMKRYLGVLGMTPADYRAKWGLPSDYPMVAPAYTALRPAQAKARNFGNKAVDDALPQPDEVLAAPVVPEMRKPAHPRR